jgi:glycosyltransferase involved in cell wall biosynthesis
VANALFTAAERRAARATDHFVVVADAMARQYLAAGIGRPGQYTRVFSGFDLAPFLAARDDPALRRRLGLGPDDFVVGKIARLCALKGHDDLLAAAPAIVAAAPHARFLLVGDGAWRARLGAEAARRGLAGRCVFAGLVRPEEIPALVGVMDVLVHLSRREGLPRALPQALAGGRPVVAYDCDGAGEACLDGRTGFLVRPGDLAAFAGRVVALARDAGLRARLGEAGRDHVRGRFTVERMVDDLHALYLRLP